jgi:hypothetical protein
VNDCNHEVIKCMKCMRDVTSPIPLAPDTPELGPALQRIKALEKENGDLGYKLTIADGALRFKKERIDELVAALETITAAAKLVIDFNLFDIDQERYRPVGGGLIKDTLTGEVNEPTTISIHDPDFPK